MNIIAPPDHAPIVEGSCRSSLLFVCAPTDKEDELMAISEPAYCREGFSQLVALLRSRSHEDAIGEVCYGHRLIARPSDIKQCWPGPRGKIQLILNGRFYYGQEVHGHLVNSPSVIRRELAKINLILGSLGLGDILIESTDSDPCLGRVVDNSRRYIVSVPEIFATNTWTLSVATYITRSILMDLKGLPGTTLGNLLHIDAYEGLGLSGMPLLEAALMYMSAVRPTTYRRLSAHGWSLTFGMASLFMGAGRALLSEDRFGGDLAPASRFASSSDSTTEHKEIYNLVKYLKQL